MKMLEKGFFFGKETKALATIALILASTLVVGQTFVSIQPAEAAPDRTDPTVRITSPIDGSKLISTTSRVVIIGTAADNTGGSGVKTVQVKVDGSSYVTATPKAAGDWSTWSITADVKTSGNHRITPRVTDNAGNQAWNSININVVIDSTAPNISIASPASGSALSSSSLTVQGTASDSGSGINNVQVRLDGSSYVTATPKAAGDWSTWSIPFNSLSDGLHTFSARATDNAGNYRDVSISATVTTADTTAPLVAVTSPAANSQILTTAESVSVTGTASDIGSGISIVEVRVDSGSYVPTVPKAAGDWSTWSLNLPTPSAGEYRLLARATDKAGNQAWNSIYVTLTDPPSTGNTLDEFGIKKIYSTAQGGNEWYVDMNDPRSDPMFRNLPSMTKQSDGSWRVSASQVRMEAWSPDNEKWLNVEITGYAKIVSGTNELLQWYSRGGHHTSNNECLGSAYKARLYGDGEARWVKEVTHPAYTGGRGTMQATNTPLEDRWIGFKAVIYNFQENGKTFVRMESYIDDDVTDSNGNLVIGNNWELASVVEDKGGWSTTNADFNASCFPLNKDSTDQYRQRDEIINMSGGTSSQNIAAWRSDGLTWDFKYLSVREIVPS